MRIIPLTKYCEITGLTRSAILARINRGTWRVGKEILKLKGIKEYHVDTKAVDSWMLNPTNQE